MDFVFTHFYIIYSMPLFFIGAILAMAAWVKLKNRAPAYLKYSNQLKSMDNLQLDALKLLRKYPNDRELKHKAAFFRKEFYHHKNATRDTREALTREVLLYILLLIVGISIVFISIWWGYDMYKSIS